jgi:hypothetical protein
MSAERKGSPYRVSEDMANKIGRFAIIEQFLADGMHDMLGNPGSVEQGSLDALWDGAEMEYILTLQETVAVMAADGYVRRHQEAKSRANTQFTWLRQCHRSTLSDQARTFPLNFQRT